MAAVAIALLIPWLSPLSFGASATHWKTGSSGTTYITVGKAHRRVPISTAWTSNVDFRDSASADPPNRTLRHLGKEGILVWASIQPQIGAWPPSKRHISARLALANAYRFPCCEAIGIGGGEWEMYGYGPHRAYTVLVRIYWGSPPTVTMKRSAQSALLHLERPQARSR